MKFLRAGNFIKELMVLEVQTCGACSALAKTSVSVYKFVWKRKELRGGRGGGGGIGTPRQETREKGVPNLVVLWPLPLLKALPLLNNRWLSNFQDISARGTNTNHSTHIGVSVESKGDNV